MYVNILIRISLLWSYTPVAISCPAHQHTCMYTCMDTNFWVQLHTHSYLVMRSHIILLDFMVIAVRFLPDSDHLLTYYLVCFLPQPLLCKFHRAREFYIFHTLLYYLCPKECVPQWKCSKSIVKWLNELHTFNTRMEVYYYFCQKRKKC